MKKIDWFLIKRDIASFISHFPTIFSVIWHNRFSWDWSYAINLLTYKLEHMYNTTSYYEKHHPEMLTTINHLKGATDFSLGWKEQDEHWQKAMTLLSEHGRHWWF